MAAADEIIVKITADATALESGLAAAADSVQQAQASIASAGDSAASAIDAQAAQMDAAFASIAEGVTAAADTAKASLDQMAAAALAPIELLNSIADGTATSMDALAAQEDQLDAALAAGSISAEDYATALAELDAQTDALGVAMDAAAAAQERLVLAQNAAMSAVADTGVAEDAATAEVDANTAATDANTEAQAANGAARRGAYMPMGIYGAGMRAMQFAATPVGMVTAAIAAVGVAAVRGAIDQNRFNDALIATGQASGASAGQLRTLAASIAATGPSLFQSEDALLAIARSGNRVGVSMQTAAAAVADMTALTGEKAQQAAQQFESLGTGGVRAIAKLNDQFQFLTPTEAAQIIHLEKIGDTTKAATVAAEDFASTMKSRMDAATASMVPLARAWGGIKSDVEESIAAVEDFGNKAAAAIDKVLSRAADAREGVLAPAPFESGGAFKKQVDSWTQADVVDGYIAFDKNGVPRITAAGMRSRPGDAGHGSLATPGPQALEEVIGAYDRVNNVMGIDSAAVAQHSDVMKKATDSLDAFAHAHGSHGTGRASAASLPDATSFDAHVAGFTQHDMGVAFKGLPDVSGEISAANAHAQALASIQQTNDQQRVTLGEASNQQVLADAQASAQAVYDTRVQYLNQELQVYSDQPAKIASINDQIVAAQDQLAEKTAQIQAKSAQQSVQTWQSILSPINDAISTSVQGIVMGTETAGQARLRIEESVVAETISWAEKGLMNHIAMELAKTEATGAGVAERIALNTFGELESLAKEAEGAIKWITNEAAKAASAAFAAMASIPPAPLWGIAAAAAASAGVLALASRVVSAEGGFERVPMDNMPAVLHKDEQVLPAEYAEGLRGLVANGGGGPAPTIHIHAMDSRSFAQYLQDNPRALIDALRYAHRTGWTAA